MRALVIQHDPGSLAALVGDRLEDFDFELINLPIVTDVNDPNVAVPMPDPTDFDLIVPMGAIWSVYDTDQIGAWIGDELDLLRSAHDSGGTVLGVCFGAQALAAALGGSVVPSDTTQIGWYHLTSNDPDHLAPGPWFQWHYDRFNAPPGAEVLAYDSVGTQAFRLGRSLGLQFHPEVNESHLRRWLEMDNGAGYGELERNGIVADELFTACTTQAPLAKPHTTRLIDWFLSDIAKESPQRPHAAP